MRSASQLVSDFRASAIVRVNQDVSQPATHPGRYRRATAALSLAVLTVVPAMMIFGGNVSSVLAWEDQNPAAYWQAERARQQRGRAASRPAAPLAYAPAPARTNPLLSIFNPGGKTKAGQNVTNDRDKQKNRRNKEARRNNTGEGAQ